ncbi:MAG TPA: PIG-L deacetylase family protein [Gaiellaceae bacterium]|nr:PIG-L deacetylase family protein [Gaiellaceae bacterium]
MLKLELGRAAPLKVLAIGAHADDIEIGCGGTLLRLAQAAELDLQWVVLSAGRGRAEEAKASAAAFGAEVEVESFRDAFFRYGGEVKDFFEELKSRMQPDLVLTHHDADRHQDHRLVAELTWNTFRDQLILEYEIPKYDGDLGAPNVFFHLDKDVARRKVELLLESFPSQREKRWFTADLFMGLMRLRGMESNSPSGLAEGFYARKLSL